jgi:hypothetical protein
VQPAASVARIVKLALLVLFGVPEMTPVLAFQLAQAGKAPLTTEKL